MYKEKYGGNMKKRLLSWLLVLVMVMSIAPMSALAAENNEPAWEQYVMSAVDYEHARFSFAAVFGKSVNITKTGIDLYNSTGKLTYSAKDDVNISSSRIKIDYTVPYKGKTLMTAEPYVVADGEKYVYSFEFNMIHIHDTGDKIIEPTCTEKGYTLHGCTCDTSAYKDTYTPALGHEFVDGKCTRCGIDVLDAFTDVKRDSYCADAVQWAVANGITKGTDTTHFSPNAGCTRGQVVTFLWRAAGEPTVGGNVGFVDVAPGSYCYEAVKWAVANGITKGTDATHFSPNETCTRGQVVTFLYRAEGEPAVGGSNGFVDVAVSSYCYEAIKWAVANGITKGTDATHFSPNATCTRGQVVTFLYRAQ